MRSKVVYIADSEQTNFADPLFPIEQKEVKSNSKSVQKEIKTILHLFIPIKMIIDFTEPH